jgi:inner membrane protein YidH
MNDTPLTSNQLAEQRTEMGFGRTVMALERTLMAWIRTSLSLIGFGFTIFKFLELMQEKSGGAMRENAPRNLGLFLIFLGIFVLSLAIFQFRRAMANVRRFSETKPQFSISMIGAVGVLLVGLLTILNIFFGLGGF